MPGVPATLMRSDGDPAGDHIAAMMARDDDRRANVARAALQATGMREQAPRPRAREGGFREAGAGTIGRAPRPGRRTAAFLGSVGVARYDRPRRLASSTPGASACWLATASSRASDVRVPGRGPSSHRPSSQGH